ncbi:hypothetical protein F4825DRAFT_293405 [Nemania diffusa]|nr:hypothetical protein F4825DRAFT_293405 [Nemania diffusa]
MYAVVVVESGGSSRSSSLSAICWLIFFLYFFHAHVISQLITYRPTYHLLRTVPIYLGSKPTLFASSSVMGPSPPPLRPYSTSLSTRP